MAFRFSFGKHASEPLYDVPLSYLRWAVKSMDTLSESDRVAIRTEIYRQAERLDDQGYGEQYSPPRRPAASVPTAVDARIGLELIQAGRRALSQKYHPDINPESAEIMVRCNATADHLMKKLPLLLGGAL